MFLKKHFQISALIAYISELDKKSHQNVLKTNTSSSRSSKNKLPLD